MRVQLGRYVIEVEVSELSDKTLELRSPYNKRLLEEIRALEGASWHKAKRVWRVRNSARNRLALAILDADGPNPLEAYDCIPESPEPNRNRLYEHQRLMLAHCWTRKRCIVAGEMGVGKTLSFIELMELVYEHRNQDEWWYIAPRSGLEAVKLEFWKWKLHPAVKRALQLTTYDKLRRILERWDGPAPRNVILDESSRVKNDGAKRTQAILHMARAMEEEYGDDCHLILASGTPAPRDPTDWWAQCEIAKAGFLRESDRAKLRRRLAVIETRENLQGLTYPHLIGWRRDEVEKLYRRMKGLVLVVQKKDCLDLPELIYHEFNLTPSPATLRAAEAMSMLATNALDALNKLRQLSDGFQYQEDGRVVRGETPKDQAIIDLLDQHTEYGRLVIYAGYHASVDRVVELCEREKWNVLKADGRGWTTWDGREVQSALRTFQDLTDDSKIAFVGHPKSGGMGLTLTASPSIVFYSNDFDAETRLQAEGRIHRPSMRGGNIYDLLHLPTDRLVLERLRKKAAIQALTLGEVSEALQEREVEIGDGDDKQTIEVL